MDPIDVEMLSSDSSYASDVSDDGSAFESMEKQYKCMYCPKMFSTTQGLGGHQNAHKREKEITKKQRDAMLAHTNLAAPVPIPYPSQQFPNQYSFPPGFEQPRFKVSDLVSQAEVYHQYTRSLNPNFAGLQIDPSQRMGQGWTTTGIPFQPTMVQPQPSLIVQSPMNLDLSLGIGSSSQTQAWPKKQNGATKVATEKEDDDLSLSLSLKM